jgi:capsule synthesis protein PGA_cap
MLMAFVGDLLVNRDRPGEVFREMGEVLKAPDILFGNLESAYTDDPRPVPSALGLVSAPASNLDAFGDAGFNVLSLANNHILDVGYDAMRETRSRLLARGIKTCGVGNCVAEAREPAVLEADGVRVAFLAYASVFPMGYEATSERAGLAPMRAYNHWRDPFPTLYDPGREPVVTTVPDRADLACLGEDIRRARERADIVVTSFHWGDYTRPFRLTDHETRTARYCIDQGADMVVGHHHHALRAIEWYRGKPILYGLGHFVFDMRLALSEEEFHDRVLAHVPVGYFEQARYAPGPRKGWPLLPMHEDTRMTVMAWACASKDGIEAIGFLPCRLSPDGLVHPLRLRSPESDQVVCYLEKCNRSQRLKTLILSGDSRRIAGFDTLRVVPDPN